LERQGEKEQSLTARTASRPPPSTEYLCPRPPFHGLAARPSWARVLWLWPRVDNNAVNRTAAA